MIFREGLVKGVPGDNHLAYEVEVGNGANVREFIYVDAHTGKVIDQITGTQDAMYRRAYDGMHLPDVPPGYPDSPFWVEGDPFPTGNVEADNMILASQETYDMFLNGFGRDSFDGAGAMMDAIFNRGYSCPNASWNGQFISFCEGLTSDDVTAHEWGHAYTQYTDGLIYQWQPGALNEAASDIFGETVDRINGRGGDTPDNTRSADGCSAFWGAPPPILTITGGPAEGEYLSRASVNEPARPFTVGPKPMALSVPAGACTPLTVRCARPDRDRRLDAQSRRQQRVRLQYPRRERACRRSVGHHLRGALDGPPQSRCKRRDRQRPGHVRRRRDDQGRPAGRGDHDAGRRHR